MKEIQMKQAQVTIVGLTPLLMNKFTDANAESVKRGTSSSIRSKTTPDPKEVAASKIYRDPQGRVCIPQENLFRAIIDAGSFIKTGKSKLTTYKTSLIPAGISVVDLFCPLTDEKGKEITWEVDERPVVNPATGGRMMTYRPCFKSWQVSFTLAYDPEIFQEKLVQELIEIAGIRIGIGDYRPAKKGPFGKFLMKEWKNQTKESVK